MATSTSRSMVELHFPFEEEQRQSFRRREQQRVWAARYPSVFDEDDLRLAIGPQAARNHFFEWLAAVRFHELAGYLSLVEKYDCRSHPRKHAAFRSIVGARVFDNVMLRPQGIPDLVVHSPDARDWFFVEVKGDRDRLKDYQRSRFAELSDLTGKPVLVVNFKNTRRTPASLASETVA